MKGIHGMANSLYVPLSIPAISMMVPLTPSLFNLEGGMSAIGFRMAVSAGAQFRANAGEINFVAVLADGALVNGFRDVVGSAC